MEKKFYHYTRATILEDIIESGQIKLATASINHKNERPCAWVSTNALWEPTATKLLIRDGITHRMTFKEQLELEGCARIQVEPKGLFSWKSLIRLAKMDRKAAERMEQLGIKLGASPHRWFGSLNPIPMDNWICAEIYDGEKWVEYERFEYENEL